MKGSDRDLQYMKLALRLAAKGRGRTSPNPMVGAVVVAGNRIVGQGYHRQAGGPHAEIIALQAAGRRAKHATLYVTLEPCCHSQKRTPPCVPSVIESGVARVVVAMTDPNPLVSGQGVIALRRAGLDVSVGCLHDEAEQLNEAYGHWVRTGLPFVTLKAAMTLDGKIATANGESQWITGTEARRAVHRLRSQVDAILVGAETVLRDDPQLTVRLDRGATAHTRSRQPMRIVLDSRLRIPLQAKILRAGTCIATTAKAPTRRVAQVQATGAQVWILPAQKGLVSLRACLAKLGQQGVTSLLIEGGSKVNASALKARQVNRVALFVAPTLLGGQDAIGLIGGHAPQRLAQALALQQIRVRPIGRDLLIEGTIATT